MSLDRYHEASLLSTLAYIPTLTNSVLENMDAADFENAIVNLGDDGAPPINQKYGKWIATEYKFVRSWDFPDSGMGVTLQITSIDVAAHSPGGHLALMAEAMTPNLINQVSTINGMA